MSQLNYTTSSFIDIPIYGLLYKHTWIDNEWVDLILSVFKFDDLNYAIVDFDNQLFYFATENVPDMPLDFVGWNPSLNSEIVVNGDVSDTLQDISFGVQNDSISNLISSTPFEYVEGELIRTEINYFTFGEFKNYSSYTPAKPVGTEGIGTLAVNNKLSENEMLSYLNSLPNEILLDSNSFGKFYILGGYADLPTFEFFLKFEFNELETQPLLIYYSLIDNTPLFNTLFCSTEIYDNFVELGEVSPDAVSFRQEIGLDNGGWSRDSDFEWVFNCNDFYVADSTILTSPPANRFVSFLEPIINDMTLFYQPEIDILDIRFEKLSFFDITLEHTTNTFSKFQLPFLRNGFEKVFGLLQFENSFTSSFIITTFVWFIQFMLLHVIVDTLTFIFKLYHKLMEKVV